MIIRNKIVYVYDIEVFPNVFHCLVKNTETKEFYYFEVSERKNEIDKLIDFFSDCEFKLICGYNCIHYDNPIINYILDHKYAAVQISREKICDTIFKLSNVIISSDSPERWKRWKYANNFETLDLLTMLYSQKLRVGLKEMQVTMKYKNVQEYSGSFKDYLLEKDIDEMIKYNKNDVESTENLLYLCENDIKLRLSIEDEYGIKALNKDGVNLGMEILKIKYLEKTGKKWEDIKNLRSPCDIIDLNKVILPFISYKTPLLQNFLTEFKQQKVSAGRKAFEKHFILDGLEYSVGVGGIHSVNQPEKIIPKDDEIISDVDVASLYPSLIIEYGFYPPHLGKEFLEVYTQIKNERIEAKHNGNKLKDKTLKLSINGLSGNLQSEYSWCYSPETVMRIRINGQLFLLMLAERLIAAGCKILQANTDGLFVLRKKADEEKFKSACKEWEQITKLTLEEDRFERFYQYAINDYLAISEGYNKTKNSKLLKKKGLFIDEVTLGKGMAPMIIPKAINAYFADGIPVTETIYNCKDLNDFITYQKVSKEFSIEYNGELITRINRFYVSTNGSYLYKCKVDEDGIRSNYINLLCDSGVTICNNLEEFTEFPKNINYHYYIKEAMKIINKFEIQQLSLF